MADELTHQSAPRRYSVRIDLGIQVPTSCIVLIEVQAKDAEHAEAKARQILRDRVRREVIEAKATMRMR